MTQKRLNLRLISLIFSTGRIIRDKIRPRGKFDHSTHLQLAALHFISENYPVPMQRLAKTFMITAASTTSLVERLFKKHFVKRVSNKHDRRLILLEITPKGQKELTKHFHRINEQIGKLFSRLDSSSQKKLIDILEEFNRINK